MREYTLQDRPALIVSRHGAWVATEPWIPITRQEAARLLAHWRQGPYAVTRRNLAGGYR